VTRHAKASSAGSIQSRGGLVAISLIAALLACALFASSAFASKQVLSSFGSLTGSGSFGGELSNPRDVAVNETGVGPANAGDTYVVDEANNRIERFDSAGNFISAWGKDAIVAAVNERQRIIVNATAGTYTLSFNGSATAPIKYNEYYESGSITIENYLAALPGIGEGNVAVSGEGGPANPIIVTFQGALGGADQPTLTVDTSQLTGTVEVSTIANGTSTTSDTGSGFEICTVAIECQAGTASGENGALDHPQSVAVDQDTGNLYVSDRGNRRIDEYDGEGNFIRSFGFDVTESGPGDTGTGYEVCNEGDGDTCKTGEAGSGVGQFGEGFAELGFGIAVSPADTNASTGTVYLADSGNRRVDTFKLDGTSPSSFGSSTQFGEEQPRGVAVDSRGILYASDSNDNGEVLRYDSQNAVGGGVGFLAPILPPNNEQQEITFTGFNTGDNFKLTCPDGTQTEELTYIAGEDGSKVIKNGLEGACGAANVSVSGNPPNITVTFKGALGASNQPQMTCTALGGTGICSVTTTSEGRSGPLLPGFTAGLAVNPAGSALYVLRVPNEGPIVAQQFGPAHEPGLSAPPSAADDTHGTAGGFFSARGFGFDSTNGRFFVSATGGPHRVYVLADASSLPAPTASMSSVGAVTDTDTRGATFHGEVDPKGGLVGCKFQYSTDETNWTDVGVPSCATLDQNGGVQDISKGVSGLDPDTHYFVRLQVTRTYFSDFTPVTSAAQSFTTASGPPVLSEAKARAVDEGSVRVSAMIDPSHSPTTYVVEYGTSTALGSSTEPVSVGAGTKPIEVSPVIGGLSPATQYYFKVVATNLVDSTASDNLPAATFPAPPSFGSCPNDRFRTGPSAKLPDCRAYEQVTPNDKFGSDAYGSPYGVEASRSGDGITSFTFSGFPGSEGFQIANVLHSRFAGGEWSTAGLTTPPSYGEVANVLAWTPDLRLSFAAAKNLAGGSGFKLVMRDSADGSRTVLIPQGVGFGSGQPFTLGGAFDGDSKVVFEANGSVPVTSGPAPASTTRNVYLYDRDSGELTLAGLLPDLACASPPCVPAGGSKLPAAWENYVQDRHVVSPNGDIYFTDRATDRLYLRRDVAGQSPTTELVSASLKTNGGGPGGVATNSPQPVIFRGATPDGSKAFLTSTEELTNDANTGPEGPGESPGHDLYRYDAAGGGLIDLAPDSADPNGAEVLGVFGYSNDGSYAYFAANADLDGTGPPAQSGDCVQSTSSLSFSGSCSVYLWQADGAGTCANAGGCISFVTPVDVEGGESSSDGFNWVGSPKASRVSADGRTLVFRSQLKLTSYDNQGTPEFYRYDAESGQVACVTCNPTGAPPVGAPDLKNPNMYHAPSSGAVFGAQPFLSRNLSADGNHFFFQSTDKLVPADVNGDVKCPNLEDVKEIAQLGAGPACRDVYEWEAPGTPGGSCTTSSGAYSPANGGCIYLLSTGTGIYPSYLADVSESGDTAFIFSRQKLVPSDEDNQEDIYAVKVNGGLASQNTPRPANCEGDACRGASSQPSNTPGAGSGVFEGPGNPKQSTNQTRCPKGKRTVHTKGKVRCVAKKHKKAHKHRSKAHKHKRAANTNRRASR
jgi:sugar lactone lactonase YvrE